MKLPIKKIFGFIIALGFNTVLHAQDKSSDSLLNLFDNPNPADDYTIATFKDSRIVNFHTIETAGKRSLDFRISHRFGPLDGGINQFYGLDGGASIRLALEYSYDGILQFGVGRSNVDKLVDGYAKYRLIRQKNHNRMPLSVTLLAGMYVNTSQASLTQLPDQFHFFTSRLSYAYQVMVARKFSDVLSVQLSPTMVHINQVINTTDRNDIYAVVGLARYKFTKRMAITAEYGARVNKYTTQAFTSADPYHNSLSVGWEIETGGHVFSIHLSNSHGMDEVQSIPYTANSFRKGAAIGFNISRVFAL